MSDKTRPLSDSPVYSEDDIENWVAGGSMFMTQFGDLRPNQNLNSAYIGQLIALFLGEKPAIFKSPFAEFKSERLNPIGIKVKGDYIYREALIKQIISDNEAIFSKFGLLTPEDVIDLLNKSEQKENSLIRGLTLGIPYGSVMLYEQKHLFSGEPKYVNVHGVYWADYGYSEDSEKKQKRLRAAFKHSRILGHLKKLDKENEILERRKRLGS